MVDNEAFEHIDTGGGGFEFDLQHVNEYGSIHNSINQMGIETPVIDLINHQRPLLIQNSSEYYPFSSASNYLINKFYSESNITREQFRLLIKILKDKDFFSSELSSADQIINENKNLAIGNTRYQN
jgi:hypothetical protein